jgi:DNA-binding transcriptional MerR regulator
MTERAETDRERIHEPELISKKEVLERTGISYGQFYRWKRKGLIPESWFIRKSTFTGQETFLPRDKILERIERIKELKDEYSLEELAEMFSPEPPKRLFRGEILRERAGISRETLELYRDATGRDEPFRFREAFWMTVLEELRGRDVPPRERRLALLTLQVDGLKLGENGLNWVLWLLHKASEASFCCIGPEGRVRFDPEAQVRAKVELNRVLERAKMALTRS